jgi:hypothetical protein
MSVPWPTAPAGRLSAVRTITVAYALVWIAVRLGHWRDLAALPRSQWKPVAFAEWVGPVDVTGVTLLAGLTMLTGVVALRGRAWAVAGPVFASGVCALAVLGASWGAVLHTEQLLVLHLLVLAVAPSGRGVTSRVGWPLGVLAAVTATTYAVSGLAKLRFGGGLGWADGERLMLLVAHDNVRKRLLGDAYSPFAAWAVGHPLLFQAAAIATLVVELGAPLALVLGRRWRYAWVAVAWLFHVGVLGFMAILFPYPLVGVAFASMLPVERLTRRGHAAAARLRPPVWCHLDALRLRRRRSTLEPPVTPGTG